MMVDLSLGTADAYVQETGTWDTALSGTVFFRFYVWFGVAPASRRSWPPTISLPSGSCGAVPARLKLPIGIEFTTANGYRFFINEAAASAGASSCRAR